MTEISRVLGLDPGTRVTGWGVVERVGLGMRLVGYGTIRPPASATPCERLEFIYDGLKGVIAEQRPQATCVEEAFAGRNVRSAFRLAEARAICMLISQQAGCAVHELPPALIKKAVTGHGRASKEGVRCAVLQILDWAEDAPPPALDASDALAGAICTLQRLQTPGALLAGGALGRRRRKRSRRWTLEDVARVRGEERA
jgi:crossover junction endodeoxyribonuclease RuvC